MQDGTAGPASACSEKERQGRPQRILDLKEDTEESSWWAISLSTVHCPLCCESHGGGPPPSWHCTGAWKALNICLWTQQHLDVCISAPEGETLRQMIEMCVRWGQRRTWWWRTAGPLSQPGRQS